jgi:type II secretory ATPase GspE/PulE/Tfp pilus assembly ATPase PilB-like protein
MSSSIKDMLVKNATSDQLEAQGRKEGMITMTDEGFIRAAQKVTSIEEVLRVTSE